MPQTAFDRAVLPADVYYTLHRDRDAYIVHCLLCGRSWQCPEYPYASGYYEPLRLHLLEHGISVYKLLAFGAVTDG